MPVAAAQPTTGFLLVTPSISALCWPAGRLPIQRAAGNHAAVIRAENEQKAVEAFLAKRKAETDAEESLLAKERMVAERIQLKTEEASRESDLLAAAGRREKAQAAYNEARLLRAKVEADVANALSESPLVVFQSIRENNFLRDRENSQRSQFIAREQRSLELLEQLQNEYVEQKREVERSDLDAEKKRVKLLAIETLHTSARSKILAAPLASLEELGRARSESRPPGIAGHP